MRRLLRLAFLAILAYPTLVLLLGALYLAVPPVSTLMMGRWLTLRDVDRRYVPLTSIATVLPAAAVASEDARFCRHRGVDWDALNEVLSDEDGPSRGASTIAMQVSKNLFLWPGRSYVRKAMEIPIALYIDAIWSKRRMMEVYLNIAEWGDGIFGAEAAARRYFGKAASALSAREAALLVAVLPNPFQRDATRPSRLVGRKAARILARLRDTPTQCVGTESRKRPA